MKRLKARSILKVRVSVPYETCVTYTVEVSDPNNLEEIKQRLRERSPDDWEFDPAFYEGFGCDYSHSVERITEKDVEIVEE